MKLSIRAKQTLLFLAFGTVPMIAATPIVMNTLETLRYERLQVNASAVDAIGDVVDRNLFERYGDVQAFGINAATTNKANWYQGETSPLVEVMNKYVRNYGFYKNTLLVDLTGRVAAVNTLDNQGKPVNTKDVYSENFSQAPWFVKAVKKEFVKSDTLDGTVVSQPYYEKTVASAYNEDGYVMAFSAPVYNEQGQMIAVWVNFADFGLVEDIIKAQYDHLKETGMNELAFALENKDGIALVNYDPVNRPKDVKRNPADIGKKTLADLGIPASKESLQSPDGTVVEYEAADDDYDGVAWSRSDGALGFPGMDWTYVMHQPASETFAAVLKTERNLTILAAAVVALILVLGLCIGAFFSRPIVRMSKAINKLSHGDVSDKITDEKRGDEIGDMARAMVGLRESVIKNNEYAGMISALRRVQGTIEFDLDGTILDANQNFLDVVGYSLDEIKGQKHSMFLIGDEGKSPEYAQFWDNLRRGIAQIAEFNRKGKGGKSVWIQASYNPILDLDGKPFKVVKFATDMTKQKEAIAQVNKIIGSASSGDLTPRIDTREFTGFYGEMTNNMNSLMDTVSSPVNEAVHVLSKMAQGDLTQSMTGNYEGSFAVMRDALDATMQKLKETVQQIVVTSASVKSAASEIATGSSDLSMRTEQQASSLEETAASMEELTGTVRQNAQSATHANELSSRASQVADAGGKVVSDAVGAMSSIEKSSQKISDIIGVIDEIAFQTNLLALNAAVEAARAGDAGKGFAVVASEVRALAGRSASASKEIKALINESASQVKSGAALVNEAGETLKNIVSSVSQVATIVSDIAVASKQQATGIDEINAAVSQMDEVTQQNAALVEENTAAAHSMLEQAKRLEAMTGFFVLEAGSVTLPSHTPSTVAPRPAPRPAAKPVSKANGYAKATVPAYTSSTGGDAGLGRILNLENKKDQTMKKTLLLALLALPCAANAADIPYLDGTGTAGVALTSDYTFRGISQTSEDPAVQGYAEFIHESGIKLGIWASSVNFLDASLETDLYAAYTHAFGPLATEAGVIYYGYPGSKSSNDVDYAELYGNLGYDFGPVAFTGSLNYSPNYTLDSGTGLYPRLAFKAPLPYDFGVDGWVGRQWVNDNGKFGLPDYTDWALGVSYTFDKATAKLQYTDTSISKNRCADGCDARLIASIGLNF